MTIRVLLTDDHRLLREALRQILSHEADIEVIAEAGDGASTLDAAERLAPDVVVLDIGLPDLNGIEVAARLAELKPAPRIVSLSAYADKRFVSEMLRAGAAAYVTKSAAGTELVRAIRAVAAGQNYLCPEVAGALVSEVRGVRLRGECTRLGRREREVVRLIAEGGRTVQIAEQLHISPATVEVHRRNVMRKLGVHTVAELTKYAIREGLISL